MSASGTKRTCLPSRVMSAVGGRPDASQDAPLLSAPVTRSGRYGLKFQVPARFTGVSVLVIEMDFGVSGGAQRCDSSSGGLSSSAR